ncbi:MAG: MBOAT family protein [Deltaproteobacteria bacterium]|nr:MBOAT family protein [Deltaproteobacteria bacterium]
MSFVSLEFAAFFPVVTLIYFLTRHDWRWAVLLAASCAFYMAFIPKYIFIMATLILVDYCAGLLLEPLRGTRRTLVLVTSLVSNLGFLCAFKYNHIFKPGTPWIFPLGLSFHTFQSMSYTIEVYRGRQKAERHLGIYALYVMFYPQLCAGPIERPQHLIAQFRERHDFSQQRLWRGLVLMATGFFKKLLVADTFAIIVNHVYGQPREYSGPALWITLYAFAIQLYYDFSGYTDIARGSALVMGFSLLENFKSPYLAASIPEFWSRWHMSLTSWLRDYVYIPLGGSAAGSARGIFNAMLVFFLCGIWHGSTVNMAIFGLLNGVLYACGRLSGPLRIKGALKLSRWLNVAVTFNIIILAFTFFRAPDLETARYIYTHLFKASRPFDWGALVPATLAAPVAVSIILVVLLEIIRSLHSGQFFGKLGSFARWSTYHACFIALIVITYFKVVGGAARPRQFIYFQF